MKVEIPVVLSRKVGYGRKHAYQVKISHPDGRDLTWGFGMTPKAATVSAFSSLATIGMDAMEDLFEANEPQPVEDYLLVKSEEVLIHVRNCVREKVRIVVRDGKNWFIFADVARITGITRDGAFLKSLPDEDKSYSRMQIPKSSGDTIIISEKAAYIMLMKGNSITSRSFQKWVSEEVFPSIFRSGKYRTSDISEQTADLAQPASAVREKL